eukprot:6460908-Amphidinium_carterae.1
MPTKTTKPKSHNQQVASDPDVPDVREYLFVLPDGVTSRLRYSDREENPTLQFRLPNRDIVEDPSLSVRLCAQRVLAAFEKPHQLLRMDARARANFLAQQAHYNIRANAAAQVHNDELATRNSMAPWHLGVLAALMHLFDIFVDVKPSEVEESGPTEVIRTNHIERAKILLSLLHDLCASWTAESMKSDGAEAMKLLPAPAEFQCVPAPHHELPPNMAAFPATQAEVPKPALPGPNEEEQPGAKDVATGEALASFLKDGFGPGGTQVQSSWLSDRQIVRRTILRGKAQVTFKDMSLRRLVTRKQEGDAEAEKGKKASVSKEDWENVLEEAFKVFLWVKSWTREQAEAPCTSVNPQRKPQLASTFTTCLLGFANLPSASMRR